MSYYNESIERTDILNNVIKKLGFDDFNEDLFTSNAESLFNIEQDEIMMFTSSAIESPLKDSFFVVIYDSNDKYEIENIKEKLEIILEQDSFFEDAMELNNLEIKIIEVFGTNKIKADINRTKDKSSEIRKVFKDYIEDKYKRTYSLTQIEYLSSIIPNMEVLKSSDITIKIEDRVRSIKNLSKQHGINLISYVFTANVSDLIKIYNKMGDFLFSNNVRVGLDKDITSVGPAIQDTYLNNPEEFWHLNNGISLLIESSENIDLTVYDRIKIDINHLKNISVINGAQTLTSLAETSFNINDIEQVEGITTEEINRMNEAQKLEVLNDEKTRLREKKNNSESKAKVLLRIYSIVRENDDLFFDQQKFIEKITLSLNRQKPIIQADMAYMTNFVKNISTIYNLENSNALEEGFSFRFVRSGELESTVLKEYSLGNFAKVVKSYLIGKPGEARTNGYATLLKINKETAVSDNPVLQNSDIFKLQDEPQLFNYEAEAEEAATRHEILIRDFDKNYKPVNFAMDMHDKLKSSKLLIDLIEKFINNFEDDLTKVEEERHFISRYSLEPVAINEIKQNLKTFGKYGNLLLIALLINSLNENNDKGYIENEDDEKDIYIKYTNKDFSDWKFQKISLPGSSEEDEKVMNYQDWENKVFEFISLFAIYLTNKEDKEILESNDYKSDNLTSKLYLEYGNYRIN